MSYSVGDGKTVTFTYHNGAGALADPTATTATVTKPDGTATVYTYGVNAELVRDSLGVYHIDVIFTASGVWTVDGAATGAVTATGSTQFLVAGSTVTHSGTCSPWASAADVCDPCDDYAMDAVLLDNALQAASDVLYALSGRQWAGICTDTVRPCARSIAPDHGRPLRAGVPFGGVGFYPGPSLGGGFSPWGWCSCNRTERAGFSVPEITLGGYPITGIMRVKEDGVVLDPSTYQVDDWRYLVRLADPVTGINPGWKCHQRLDLNSDQPDTFEVTYSYGVAPPQAGVNAAAYLGCQLALACNPDTISRCQLPQRVTNIARQGVSMVVLDPMQFIDKGKTGIYLVDLFLESANPGRLSRPSVVMSPDIGRRVRRSHTNL